MFNRFLNYIIERLKIYMRIKRQKREKMLENKGVYPHANSDYWDRATIAAVINSNMASLKNPALI